MHQSLKYIGPALATLVATVALAPWGTPTATAESADGPNAWRLQKPAQAGEIEGYTSQVSGEPGTRYS